MSFLFHYERTPFGLLIEGLASRRWTLWFDSLGFPGQRERIVIGRDDECAVCLRNDEFVSGTHCALRFENECVVLEDLDSTNGTRVNGVRIREPVALRVGMHIRAGNTFARVLGAPFEYRRVLQDPFITPSWPDTQRRALPRAHALELAERRKRKGGLLWWLRSR